ncbi:hypothetical protein [Burkholderia thailandensis]|uniref:hypothetical protein n=1 Tax=Burkholderia thailandensis TaxID=57975 RepID=UPI0022ABCACD|nr:hypothetical protein [Burkholderia thailandensis]
MLAVSRLGVDRQNERRLRNAKWRTPLKPCAFSLVRSRLNGQVTLERASAARAGESDADRRLARLTGSTGSTGSTGFGAVAFGTRQATGPFGIRDARAVPARHHAPQRAEPVLRRARGDHVGAEVRVPAGSDREGAGRGVRRNPPRVPPCGDQ